MIEKHDVERREGAVSGARRGATLTLGVISLAAIATIAWLVAPPSGGDAAVATAATEQLAQEGAALFLAKGCVTCHAHAAAPPGPGLRTEAGPSLTSYSNDPAFLRRWLRDPVTVRPGTTMPKLPLSDPEIERLIAFLNQSRR